MRKEGLVQNLVIALFGITIVAMSIGFAMYSTTLTIGGGNSNTANATFTPTAWSVHYDTTSYQANSTTGYTAPTTHNVANTDIQFAINLAEPGDKSEFTVNVVNDGDFDAYLNNVVMSDPNLDFVYWKITYDGTVYEQTTNGINGKVLPYDKTNNANVKQMTVYVEYKMPETTDGLPTDSNGTVNFTASLVFDQSDTPGA